MKKILQFLIVFLGVGLGTSQAQTSNYTSGKLLDTIDVNQDTLSFVIASTPTNIIAGGVRVYYEGDFGDNVEWVDVYDENWNHLGQAGPYASQSDCDPEDSIDIPVAASVLNGWTSDDTVKFYLVTTYDVDPGNCATGHAGLTLTYAYCGSPIAYAAISVPNTSICPFDGNQMVTTSPAGGTLAGSGLTGNTFSAIGLAPGAYTLTYSYTHSTGCTVTTTASATILVKPAPMPTFADTSLCMTNTGVSLSATGLYPTSALVWYNNPTYTTPLGTGNTLATGALSSSTMFYALDEEADDQFVFTAPFDTATANAVIQDINALAGDDRGGIAVTTQYVYFTGDDQTVRFDLDLTAGSLIALPRNDGLFSDLKSGTLWTLWNGVEMPDYNASNLPYTVTALRSLDDTLGLGTDSVMLSMPIVVDYNSSQSGMFAGYGYLGIFSGSNNHWYIIDLGTGEVTDMGAATTSLDNYATRSENWSRWGNLEFDGTNFYAIYAANDTAAQVLRQQLPNGTPTVMTNFTNMSDMASLTYAPWNHRFYFHHEYDAQYGGTDETVGYLQNTTIHAVTPFAIKTGCPAVVNVTVAPCAGVAKVGAAAFQVFPNPSNGNITILANDFTSQGDVNLQVFDLQGKLVHSQQMGSIQGSFSSNLDLTSFVSGMYILKLSDAKDTHAFKVTINK